MYFHHLIFSHYLCLELNLWLVIIPKEILSTLSLAIQAHAAVVVYRIVVGFVTGVSLMTFVKCSVMEWVCTVVLQQSIFGDASFNNTESILTDCYPQRAYPCSPCKCTNCSECFFDMQRNPERMGSFSGSPQLHVYHEVILSPLEHAGSQRQSC